MVVLSLNYFLTNIGFRLREDSYRAVLVDFAKIDFSASLPCLGTPEGPASGAFAPGLSPGNGSASPIVGIAPGDLLLLPLLELYDRRVSARDRACSGLGLRL